MNAYKFDKVQKIKKKYAKIAKDRVDKEVMYKKLVKTMKHRRIHANKLMESQRKLRNVYELKFRVMLLEMGVRYIWQNPFYDKDRYVCVDFYLPEYNIVIEIDGNVHGKPEKVQYDLERTMYLKKVHGVAKVVRFSNLDITNNIEMVRKEVVSVISGI
jgi:very-short-patch-repair endonuclease